MFFRLRGTPNVKDELEDLKQSYLKEANTEVVSFKKLLTDRVYLEPFVIMLILMFLQQFSGINAVLFNLQVSYLSKLCENLKYNILILNFLVPFSSEFPCFAKKSGNVKILP